MPMDAYKYVVVGSGLTGASAIKGIRERDCNSPIVLFGDEGYPPYDRPPLSKKLWFGKMKVKEIFINDDKFYKKNKVELKLGVTINSVDPVKKTIMDNSGKSYHYDKLLLSTGGKPRMLSIQGGSLDGICYYRYLQDFNRIRLEAKKGKSAVIVGGGFIGSELAAALNINKVKVTMIFPDAYLCIRVFPEYLGKAMQKYFVKRGIKILNDKPAAFLRKGEKFITRTEKGKDVESDIVIVGVGIDPEIKLAQSAGLKADNGILVNHYLQTSNKYIYAAGDNARFPCKALGRDIRVEHWDTAIEQGKLAGRNMAGAGERVDYLPFFFSDLFEFGYEAVGDIDSKLKTFADWQDKNRKGVIYYLKNNKVRGVMLCNVWKKVDTAKELIRKGAKVGKSALHGAIR